MVQKIIQSLKKLLRLTILELNSKNPDKELIIGNLQIAKETAERRLN